jgi:DNA-binding NarL/FixJ family response regulator
MRLIFCFIDDSDFEHDLVRNRIAPFAPELTFVQAYTFEEARKTLGREIPVLFLLDLWGQDRSVVQPVLTSKDEVEKKVSHFKNLHDVYEGLENFPGDKANEYLKRMFTIVDSWRSLFEEVCARIGQNRKYGLANLRQVRSHFPGVPAVFYTRKSLINDAVAMFRAGADGLFIKPTGQDDGDTKRLTEDFAPVLLEDLARIADPFVEGLEEHEAFYRAQCGQDVQALISRWTNFRITEKPSPSAP